MLSRRLSPAVAALAAITLSGSAAAAEHPRLLVVVNRALNEVSVWKAEGTALTLAKRLPVGKAPREVCIAPDGKHAYVANPDFNSISVVDLDALTIAATIQVPELDKPDGCLVSPDSKTVWALSMGRDSLLVLSADSGKLVKEIMGVGKVPRRLSLSPDGKRLWIGSNKQPEIVLVDLAKGAVERTIRSGNEPRGGVTFTPDGKTLLVGNVEDDTVSWIDTSTYEVRRVQGVPISPQRIIVSPDGAFAYVLTRFGAGLFAMPLTAPHDKSKVVALGKAPWGLAMNPEGTLLYASNNADDNVMVIDTATFKVVADVPVGKDPNGIAIRP